jgi:hypothetical protein
MNSRAKSHHKLATSKNNNKNVRTQKYHKKKNQQQTKQNNTGNTVVGKTPNRTAASQSIASKRRTAISTYDQPGPQNNV